MDAECYIEQDDIKPRLEYNITDEEIENQLKKTKKQKATGPNGMKSELIIALSEINKGKIALRNALDKALNEKEIPKNWKTSNTSLLEKVAKLTKKDLRPIALTDTTYKLMMGILRYKMQMHLKENKQLHELQTAYVE